jgi:ankyrin repeat protein
MSSPAPLPVDIYRSAQRGELQKVVKWLRKEGPVDALHSVPTRDGRTSTDTLLQAAAACGQLEMVRMLLQRGAGVNLQTSLGNTALTDAAFNGHRSIVLLLLQHSADPDLQNIDGETVLMSAALQGHEACVKALLRAKANVELLDKDGDSALLRAEVKGHTATAALIRQHAAPRRPDTTAAPAAPAPDAGEPAGAAASLPVEVHRSAKRGDLQKVVRWLRKGGPIDALGSTTTRSGHPMTGTLLQAAAGYGHLEMVRMLLEQGASINLPSSTGFTALMIAASYDHLPILLVLLQHSANIDLQDTYGDTALMSAAGEKREGPAAIQGQHRAARQRRRHRPASRRGRGPHEHREAHSAARSTASSSTGGAGCAGD